MTPDTRGVVGKTSTSRVSNFTPHKPPHTNTIEVLTYCQNFNRMQSAFKLDKINKAVTGCNYSVILGTETSWNDSIKNEEVFGNMFTVFRDDRDLTRSGKKSGGGVLVAIDAKYGAEQIESQKFDEFEHVWAEALIAGETHIFASVYFPPSHSNKQTFEKFFGSVEKIISNIKPESKIHIYGDFNQRTADFIVDEDNESLLLPVVGQNETLQYFFEEISKFGLYQVNNVKNRQNCYLDLLFTNVTEDFCVSSAPFPLWKNEAFHTAIEYSQFFHTHQNNNNNDWEYEEVLEYGKANIAEIKRRLGSLNWRTVLGNELEVDSAVDKFYRLLHEILDVCVPTKRRKRRNSKDPNWFTKALVNLRNKKNKAYKKFKICGQAFEQLQSHENQAKKEASWQNYVELREQFNSHMTTTQEEYHRKVERDIRSDSKKFFDYVKSKQKSNNFPSNMFLREKIGKNSSDISNLFADFFENNYTTFSESDRDRDYFSAIPEPHTDITLRHLSLNEIEAALKGIDGSKGPGPDGVPPSLVKELFKELTEPLFWLYNLSLTTRKFPMEWKKSFLIPIYKSGKKSDIENYRGVAIISCIPKLFESIVNEKMFYQVKHLISDSQHGFFKGRSTATNLIQFVSFTLEAMDRRNSVKTLYTDFSKAFDRIDIPMLLFKLRKIGVETTFLEWIESYLTSRTQIVKFNGSTSRSLNVTSGVPQGSHLGPLLFILFINDISLFLNKIKVLTYADDMKLFMEIAKLSDATLFQDEVDKFHEWCTKSLLQLNVKKCNIVFYNRKKHCDFETDVNLGHQVVAKCDKIRDLGVILDSKLAFTDHYNTMIHKARNTLNFIKRFSYNFQDPYTLKTLYITYVRSSLEYCSLVWSPHLVTYIDKIESVQKQFLLFALRNLGWTTFPLPSYESRCMLISLDTLKKRREFACLSFVNDIVSHRINAPILLQNLNFYAPVRILRTRSLFQPNSHRTNYSKYSPINRIMSTYNVYSETIDITMSKSMLKKHFFNHHARYGQ